MNAKSLLTDEMLIGLRSATEKLPKADPLEIFDHLNQVIKLFKKAEQEGENAKKKIKKLLGYIESYGKAVAQYETARAKLDEVKAELIETRADIKALDDFKFIRAEDRRTLKFFLDRACYFAKANSPVPVPALFLDEDQLENKLYSVDTEAKIRFEFKGGGGIDVARKKFIEDLAQAAIEE